MFPDNFIREHFYFYTNMLRICVILFVFVFSVADISAQRCEVREEINSLNDSLCWTIGTKDYFEFIVDKSTPGKNLVSLSVMSPGRLSASIGDSAWISLDNGYMVKLSNIQNFKSTSEIHKALYVHTQYYFVRFLSEISSDDIKSMATNKVSKVSLDLNPVFNMNYEIIKVKKHPFVPKTSTYILKDNRVEVRINKVTPINQKNIMSTAVCASKYVR